MALEYLKNFSSTSIIGTPSSKPEPSHVVNPRDKNEAWILDMAKANWEKWQSYNTKSFFKGADRYQLNELYSIGKQPNDIYKPWFKTEDDENTSFMNLDFTPIPVVPKFKRITLNKAEKMEFTIEADAIDDYALEDKEQYEGEEWARIKMREVLQGIGQDPSMMDTDELDQPKTTEELAIKMEFGYKHNMAIDIEKRIDAVFSDERMRQDLLPRIRESFWNKDVAGIKVYTEPETGRVRMRNVDISRFVCAFTEDKLFRDPMFMGEVLLMTIADIRKHKPDIDERELEKLASKNQGLNGNPKQFGKNSIGTYAYDDCLIPVLDTEFKTLNVYKYEQRQNKRGNPVVGKVDPKDKEKKDREYMNDSGIYWYKAMWVIDTDILFEYGMCQDMAAKNNDTYQPQSSYVMRAISMNRFETNPIVEQIIPFADQIVLAYIKLQGVIATARPKGIAIEIGALEEIGLGQGGEVWKPMKVIDMLNQTGNIVFRRIDAAGNVSQANPITELDGGMGSQANEYFNIIQQNFQLIRDTLGFNEVTDGSTPDAKMLNGVAEMSTEATNNALFQLISAERDLVERVADVVAIRVHDSMALRDDSYYGKIFGPSTLKSAKQNKDAIHRVYGIHLSYASDKRERAKLDMRIDNSLALGPLNGGISLNDSYAIEHCKNTKQAERILAYRVQKNMENAQRMKQQDSQMNAQIQQQSAAATAQGEQQTIQMKGQVESQLLDREWQYKLQYMEREYQLKGQLEFGNKEGKKEVEDVKNSGIKDVARIKTDGKRETVSI